MTITNNELQRAIDSTAVELGGLLYDAHRKRLEDHLKSLMAEQVSRLKGVEHHGSGVVSIAPDAEKARFKSALEAIATGDDWQDPDDEHNVLWLDPVEIAAVVLGQDPTADDDEGED